MVLLIVLIYFDRPVRDEQGVAGEAVQVLRRIYGQAWIALDLEDKKKSSFSYLSLHNRTMNKTKQVVVIRAQKG